jgi:hypothetical protein
VNCVPVVPACHDTSLPHPQEEGDAHWIHSTHSVCQIPMCTSQQVPDSKSMCNHSHSSCSALPPMQPVPPSI